MWCGWLSLIWSIFFFFPQPSSHYSQCLPPSFPYFYESHSENIDSMDLPVIALKVCRHISEFIVSLCQSSLFWPSSYIWKLLEPFSVCENFPHWEAFAACKWILFQFQDTPTQKCISSSCQSGECSDCMAYHHIWQLFLAQPVSHSVPVIVVTDSQLTTPLSPVDIGTQVMPLALGVLLHWFKF